MSSIRPPVVHHLATSLVLGAAALTMLGVAVTADAQPSPPGETTAKFFDPSKLPFNTKVFKEGLKAEFPDWPTDSQTGATVKRLSGPKIGLTARKLPGVKFLKSGETGQLDVTKHPSGLYVVGVDFVPPDLPAALKAFGYKLQADGKLLDRNNEPLVAFVTAELYQIEKRNADLGPRIRSGAEPSGLFAALSEIFQHSLDAAHPFAWACYSFTPWAVYHGGFHRWYDARTWASAYGADGSGGCSWASPLTNIDYISTRAAVGWPGSENHCFSCSSEYSRDVWDVGYFWPAHGVPTTTHSGVWADGSFSFSRVAHLSW